MSESKWDFPSRCCDWLWSDCHFFQRQRSMTCQTASDCQLTESFCSILVLLIVWIRWCFGWQFACSVGDFVQKVELNQGLKTKSSEYLLQLTQLLAHHFSWIFSRCVGCCFSKLSQLEVQRRVNTKAVVNILAERHCWFLKCWHATKARRWVVIGSSFVGTNVWLADARSLDRVLPSVVGTKVRCAENEKFKLAEVWCEFFSTHI